MKWNPPKNPELIRLSCLIPGLNPHPVEEKANYLPICRRVEGLQLSLCPKGVFMDKMCQIWTRSKLSKYLLNKWVAKWDGWPPHWVWRTLGLSSNTTTNLEQSWCFLISILGLIHQKQFANELINYKKTKGIFKKIKCITFLSNYCVSVPWLCIYFPFYRSILWGKYSFFCFPPQVKLILELFWNA